MKNIIFITVFFLPLIFFGQPVFYTENSTIHFENVIQKSEIMGEFLIENRGNEILELIEIIPYCNCTILNRPTSITSNSKEKITFTITPKVAEGDWRTVIKIITNEPKDNTHKLNVTMNVIPLLKFLPQKVDPLILLPEDELDVIFKIISPAKVDFSVLDFYISPENILKFEPHTPFGEKITPDKSYEFKIKSIKPLNIGENYFNFKIKTDIKNLPISGYQLKVFVKDYIWAEPNILMFNVSTKPGIISPLDKNKVAYANPNKDSKLLFKLKPGTHYKVISSTQGWYQIKDFSSDLFGWIPWGECIVIDDGYQATAKIFSAKNTPFKILSISCPENFSCNYKFETDHYSLSVQRLAPISSLAENFGNLEIITDFPKKEKLLIPLTEEKIEKYKQTKESINKKLKLNPKFKDKKIEDAESLIKIDTE